MSEKTTSDNDVSINNNTSSVRLPCRGCTADCKNYQHCGGSPWRMTSRHAADQYKK